MNQPRSTVSQQNSPKNTTESGHAFSSNEEIDGENIINQLQSENERRNSKCLVSAPTQGVQVIKPALPEVPASCMSQFKKYDDEIEHIQQSGVQKSMDFVEPQFVPTGALSSPYLKMAAGSIISPMDCSNNQSAVESEYGQQSQSQYNKKSIQSQSVFMRNSKTSQSAKRDFEWPSKRSQILSQTDERLTESKINSQKRLNQDSGKNSMQYIPGIINQNPQRTQTYQYQPCGESRQSIQSGSNMGDQVSVYKKFVATGQKWSAQRPNAQQSKTEIKQQEPEQQKQLLQNNSQRTFKYQDSDVTPMISHEMDQSVHSEEEMDQQEGEVGSNSSMRTPDELSQEATPEIIEEEQKVEVLQQTKPVMPPTIQISPGQYQKAASIEVKEGDVEQTLRQVLDLPDAQIYDVHMILQILRKKYNKNYFTTIGPFKIKQKDEMRKKSEWPQVICKMTAITRKICSPVYQIMQQEAPRNYPVKFDLDPNDPACFSDGPPQTTAKSWSVFDCKKNICVMSKNNDQKLEIASMTKIMTCYTCFKILYGDWQCVNINPKKVYFRASYFAAKINGTTAFIREGLRYSIYDLLCGLMLPSGNDASLVLAENFGRFLVFEQGRTSAQIMKDACEADCYDPEQSRAYVIRFIKRMNQESAKLKLTNTSFSNSHGLSDKANKSTAQDVIRLTMASLKFPLFSEIIKKFVYESRVVFDFDISRPSAQRGVLVHQKWYNLNILLNDPKGRYRGVKTGQTPTAGSCLCTLYVDDQTGHKYLCVVIGTNTNKHRFQETTKLINWCIGQQLKQQQLTSHNSQQGNSYGFGSTFANQLRNGSQSGQGAGMSGLAKMGTNIMMNMSNGGQKKQERSSNNNSNLQQQQKNSRTKTIGPALLTRLGNNQVQTLNQFDQTQYAPSSQNNNNSSQNGRPQSLSKADRMDQLRKMSHNNAMQQNAVQIALQNQSLGFGRFNPNFY